MRRSNCSTLIPSGAYQFCKAKTNSTRESWFSELPEILIVHLKRFRMKENTPRKDFRQVKHGDNITIDGIFGTHAVHSQAKSPILLSP